MKSVSIFALAAALAGGGLAAGSPAAAQKAAASSGGERNEAGAQAAEQQGQRKYDISKEARNAIAALQKAVNDGDAAAIAPALAAAQAVAKTPDDHYVIAQLRLNRAVAMKDEAEQAAAIDALLQSGAAQPADLPKFYQALSGLHYNAKRYDQAAAALQKLLELQPGSSDPLLRLAELRIQEKKPAEAVTLIERAISQTKASGQPVPENWYKRALKFAYENKLRPETARLSRDLVLAYPTEANWSDMFVIYRETANLDKAASVDLYRLMRATKALRHERDYFDYAYALAEGGFPGEAKAVLDEGVAARVVDPAKPGFKELTALAAKRAAGDRETLPAAEKQALAATTGRSALGTADAYLGYGDYAKAVPLYRAALQKGGVDANLVNSRLGMALAFTGQRAEAEAVFKTVAGPRADIASLWLLWLNGRA